MSASSKEQWDLEDDTRPVNPTDNPTFESVLAAYLNRRLPRREQRGEQVCRAEWTRLMARKR